MKYQFLFLFILAHFASCNCESRNIFPAIKVLPMGIGAWNINKNVPKIIVHKTNIA